ncbi:aminoacyl-tRNA hydrolase [Pseudonocardiaceae bacterium YIM PH 21723]|nr:aminoacyl-tRNA hydrolase [Pseudonocardiaceae bacterium YIM PH 21723]
MAQDLRVTESVVIPGAELLERFSRSSGPGGQSVNTTDSRVELVFDLAGTTALTELQLSRAVQRLGSRLTDGVLTISAAEHRSQWQNRGAARTRLAELLRTALAPPPPPRRPTKPSRGSKERRLAAKSRRSQVKRLRRSSNDD